jgi:hypothetical protein
MDGWQQFSCLQPPHPSKLPMFGLIGHSTNLEEARTKARLLGYEEYA